MRQFLERFVSLLTVLLAALALAQLADAQTLPDPDPQGTQVGRLAEIAAPPPTIVAARLTDSGVAGGL